MEEKYAKQSKTDKCQIREHKEMREKTKGGSHIESKRKQQDRREVKSEEVGDQATGRTEKRKMEMHQEQESNKGKRQGEVVRKKVEKRKEK